MDAPAQRVASTAKPNDTGLPVNLKTGVEALSGLSMDDVKVHYNSQRPAQLNAHAFAQGSDIHLGSGQEQHLPHEAWHVVQQKQGRVKATAQAKGLSINDDPVLEREADQMGAKAAAEKPSHHGGSKAGNGIVGGASHYYQRRIADEAVPTVQLKGNNLLTVDRMKSGASASVFFGDSYDAVLDEVAAYYDPGQTPNNNFGKQLRRLSMIRAAIQVWVQQKGPLAQAVVKGVFGYSSDDKRRLVLRQLENSVAAEETHVQQEGKQSSDNEHQQDRAALKAHIEAGMKSTDTRLRNTCEWIETTDKTKIYAVTSTGDAYERLHRAGMSPTADGAFFPTGLGGSPGDIKGPAVHYVESDLANQTNVNLKAGGARTGGWQSDGHVAITNVSSKPRKQVLEVLTHEVQHDADKHYGRDSRRPYREAGEALDATGSILGPGGITHPDLRLTPQGAIDWGGYGLTVNPDGSPDLTNVSPQASGALRKISGLRASINRAKEKLVASNAERDLERYKTEYRAYAYQESSDGDVYARLGNAVQDKTHGGEHFSERQLAIFKHIYAEYSHTRNGWNDNVILADGVTSFRRAVASYWNPDTEGFNKLNSVRIDNVYNALDAIGIKAAPTQVETLHGVDAAPVGAGNKISDKTAPGVVKLLEQIDRLQVSECDYILNQSRVWPDKLSRHLDGEALATVNAAMHRQIAYDRRMKEDASKARMTNFWGR